MGCDDCVEVEPLKDSRSEVVLQVRPVGEDVEDKAGLVLVTIRNASRLQFGEKSCRYTLYHPRRWKRECGIQRGAQFIPVKFRVFGDICSCWSIGDQPFHGLGEPGEGVFQI